MNSVIIAKKKQSVIPSFARGELVINASKTRVVLVTGTTNAQYGNFNGTILFSIDYTELGLHTAFYKCDFKLFSSVIELSN